MARDSTRSSANAANVLFVGKFFGLTQLCAREHAMVVSLRYKLQVNREETAAANGNSFTSPFNIVIRLQRCSALTVWREILKFRISKIIYIYGNNGNNTINRPRGRAGSKNRIY